MTALKAIRDDHVEKRLWPLAVVLAILVVGVPIVLSRSGSGSPAPDPTQPGAVVAPTGAVASTAQRVVLDQTHAARPVTGTFHDPFRSGKGAAAASGAAATGSGVAKTVPPPKASGSSASSGSASSGSTTGSSTGAATTVASSTTPAATSPSTTGTTSPATQPAATPVVDTRPKAGYRVDLEFGEAGATKTVRDTIRLRTLGATPDSPVAIFLGVTRTHGAMFLLPQNADVSGDGQCLPSAQDCEIVELRHGDSEFLDVQGATGLTQYELDVDRVALRHADTSRAAAKLRKRESKAGREALLATIAAGRAWVSHYVYSATLGAVVLRHSAKKAAARGQLQAAPTGK